MPNLKKLFKSKTFFIPALSYIGIIVLLFIGAVLESIKIFPTGDMGGSCFWILLFASLPIVGLHQFLNSVAHYKLEGLILVFSLVLMFVYHLLIGFGLGFLINFIYRCFKSQIIKAVKTFVKTFKSKYTLYGGAIGAIIMIFLGFMYLIPFEIFIRLPQYLFGSNQTFNSSIHALLLIFLAFILGAVIGGITGKIKSIIFK